tara:strand:- start:121 stop:492 length:372 start_codon:yes stop_codon:yes gene_type:complete
MKLYLKHIFSTLFLLISSQIAVFGDSKLIMITDSSCIFCQRWERDIGQIYPKTDMAEKFPLTRIEFNSNQRGDPYGFKNILGTPTFIFLKDEVEIGRIEGFNDAEMFWWLVEDIMISSGLSSE